MVSFRLGFPLLALVTVSVFASYGCAKDAGAPAQQCTAGLEVCNGIDDDCDKLIDEDDTGMMMTRDCSNGCGAGKETCIEAAWAGCDAPAPATETCNGKDDDCDGFADNGFECALGATQECGSDVGECDFGTQSCQNGCTWGSCLGDTPPQDEECEGQKDDDCDGTVDNGCSCTNGDTKDCCGGTQIVCQNNKWPSCPTPPAEVCNGVDEDCSGIADDNLPDDPYMADEASSGTDSCEQAHTGSFTVPVIEDGGPEKYDFRLYKANATIDRDFFSIPTAEASDFACAANPSYYECYMISVRISQEPAGKDYELCVYDMGGSGPGASCAGKPKTCSKADGNPANEVLYLYEGACGSDDDNRFVVEVFGVSDADQSCEPYSLEVEVIGDDPQPMDCGL